MRIYGISDALPVCQSHKPVTVYNTTLVTGAIIVTPNETVPAQSANRRWPMLWIFDHDLLVVDSRQCSIFSVFYIDLYSFTCLFTSDHSSNIIHRVDEVFRCFFLDSVGRTRETRTQVFFVNENFIALLPAWKMSNSYHRCRRSIHQYSLAVVLHERPGALEFSRRAMIWRGAQLAGQPVQRPCAGGAVGWTYGSWESRGLSFVTAALDECATGTLRSTLCVCVCVCVTIRPSLISLSFHARDCSSCPAGGVNAARVTDASHCDSGQRRHLTDLRELHTK